jgi:tetratricopeptide (TPR) repeat protein
MKNTKIESEFKKTILTAVKLLTESKKECLKFARKALKLAVEMEDETEQAKVLNFLGKAESKFSHYTQSLTYLERAKEIALRLDDYTILASIIHTFAQVFWLQDDFKNMMKYNLELLQIYEEKSDKDGIASSSHNIGLAYRNMGDAGKALEYYLRS